MPGGFSHSDTKNKARGAKGRGGKAASKGKGAKGKKAAVRGKKK